MPCPTCNHTMHGLGENEGRRHFWCPRCGTVKTMTGEFEDATVPTQRADPQAAAVVAAARELMDVWGTLPDRPGVVVVDAADFHSLRSALAALDARKEPTDA
jgi:Zn-finger nucleic acid-binding protein